MLDCEVDKRQSPSCRILFVLFSIVFVLIGPLKPEVEEEVAEHELCISLVHFSPPLYSPQEPHAVRRAALKTHHWLSWFSIQILLFF